MATAACALVPIVPCTPENIAYVVGLGRELQQLGSLSHVAFDWQFALASTTRAATDPDYYIRAAVSDEGQYVGFVGGHMTTFFFSPTRFGVEDAWFVRAGTPSRARYAMSLMRGFVSWVMDHHQGVMVQSGDIAAINTVAVHGLYTRLGFRRYGTIYKYAREV